MKQYQDQTRDIPWASLGRDTVASHIGRHLHPIGIPPYDPPPFKKDQPLEYIDSSNPNFERFLTEIYGTAIQCRGGKLVTCRHVLDAVAQTGKRGFVLLRTVSGNTVTYTKFAIPIALNYVDPRSNSANLNIDLVAIPFPAESLKNLRGSHSGVRWGDSTKLGFGDQIFVGGYPYGTQLFTSTNTNRGVIQPTFFPGIVSSIIPATRQSECRILVLSTAVAGGTSGGAVFDPRTGAVLGMVFAGLVGECGTNEPITYAIPSEIIAPFVDAINFKSGDKHWGKRSKFFRKAISTQRSIKRAFRHLFG